MSDHIPAEALSFQHLGKDVRLSTGVVGSLRAIHMYARDPDLMGVEVYDFGLLCGRSHTLRRDSRVEVLDA